MSADSNTFQKLPKNTNQAQGIAEYAITMLQGKHDSPSDNVLQRTELFHLDSIACGLSAIACGTNAPNVLRAEALRYALRDGSGAPVFGSTVLVPPEKAVAAGSSAVREWDSNGTNFGYNPERNGTAGEFGHNDFYPVVMAAAFQAGLDGRQVLVGMTVLDEIRGRLAEVFALKNYKIDHVLHGAIASAAVYAAILGANAKQIESAIGMVVAHYVPFRAIRAGKQLSDSKGSSAAISAEAAVLSAQRAMNGFIGPADIFRNPQAIFCLFETPEEADCSPFDLELATNGDDFAIMGMHFKLGLYEHQSAGAIQGLINVLEQQPELLDDFSQLKSLDISIYEPAFSIIGDPAKRDPQTRQSADHSMVYIIATLLRKAYEARQNNWDGADGWKTLMLLPNDYEEDASGIFHPLTREIMEKINFKHGGPEFDAKYPDGIPTSLSIEHAKLGEIDSGLVMYPVGHARCTTESLNELLKHKFTSLATLATDDVQALSDRFTNLTEKSPEGIRSLYNF